MKPSFLKFLNFLNKINLSQENIDKLHQLLFTTPLSHQLSIDMLKIKLNIPENYAEKIFRLLIETSVLDLEIFECHECGAKITLSNNCPECNIDIDNSGFYVNIDGLVDENSTKLIQSKYFESKKAEIIAREWDEKKYLSYVLIDLVDSEKVQEVLHDQNYAIFLEEIRNILKYHALSQLSGEYLILGEIGDCTKIAFTQKDDVITFFKNFSKELDNRITKSKIIQTYLEQLEYFPKFSGIVDTLPLPSTTSGFLSPKNIIVVTLNGSIDFNSKALTGLFRLDSGAKVDKGLAFQNHNTSLWMGENFIKETKYQNLSTVDIEVGKHNKILKKTALVLFTNGVENIIENPIHYINVSRNEKH